jgi:hypothetical protein
MREQSAVLQNAFVTIVSNRRLLAQLQQVKSPPDICCAVEGWHPLTPASRTIKRRSI